MYLFEFEEINNKNTMWHLIQNLILLAIVGSSVISAKTLMECSNQDQVCVTFPLCDKLNGNVITTANGLFKSSLSLQECDKDLYEVCCLPPPEFRRSPRNVVKNIVTGCGFNNQQSLMNRIIGGFSETGELPWNVALMGQKKYIQNMTSDKYFCGGSLIHPKIVLTAQHCLKDAHFKEISQLTVRAGEMDLRYDDKNHQDRHVAKIVKHDSYRENNQTYDIALLFLTEEFKITDNVGTICVPYQDQVFDRERCWVSGFGANKVWGPMDNRLRKVDVPIVPNDECQAKLRNTGLGPYFKLHTSFICAGGEKGKDACRGDGGAALVCKVPGTANRFCQAGIVSYGIGCGEENEPAVYARVSMFRDWIDEQFAANGVEIPYKIDKKGECTGPNQVCGKPHQCDINYVIIDPLLEKQAQEFHSTIIKKCADGELCCQLASKA